MTDQNWADWLETEISAISCWHHGTPSYDHDANWMKDRVLHLIGEARKVFASSFVTSPPATTTRAGDDLVKRLQLAGRHPDFAIAMEAAAYIAALATAPEQVGEAVSAEVIAAIQAYGDARADQRMLDGAAALERVINLLRTTPPPASTNRLTDGQIAKISDEVMAQMLAKAPGAHVVFSSEEFDLRFARAIIAATEGKHE